MEVALKDEPRHRNYGSHPRIASQFEPRAGWDEAFGRMALRGDDTLLDREALGHTAWDEADWEWSPAGSTGIQCRPTR